MSYYKDIAQQKTVMHQAIESAAAKFADSRLDFPSEQVFAVEQLLKNDYSMSVAANNPTSLKLAMYNVAMVGLSLNPQLGQAYLIPRKTKSSEPARIVLDISYRGLIDIGTSSNSIVCAKSVLVYSQDRFQYNGPMDKPLHEFDPFASKEQRGELRGAYCQAKLPSGDYLIEPMSLEEMLEIRNKSEAFKKGFGPWVDWPEQMFLKCPLKRAFKWWPNQNNARMASAMKILNEENGEGINLNQNHNSNVVSMPVNPRPEDVSPEVKQNIATLIQRASNANAWSACKDLMEQRIKTPNDLAYALEELKKAQQVKENVIQGEVVTQG